MESSRIPPSSEHVTPSNMSSATTPAISVAPTLEKTDLPSDIEKQSQQGSKTSLDASLAPNEEGTRSITGIKWALVCVSLYISAFLYGLDTTIALGGGEKLVLRNTLERASL